MKEVQYNEHMNTAVSLFFDRIFSPSPHLTRGSAAWYRARLTMAIGVLLLGFYFIPELALHLGQDMDAETHLELYIILGGSLMIMASLVLARTRRYLWGMWLLLLGWTFDILLDVLLKQRGSMGATLEVWLIFGLVMAFLLLDLRDYALFALFQGLATSAVLLEKHGMVFPFNVRMHLAAVTFLGLGVWLRVRDRTEHETARLALTTQKEYLQHVIDGIQAPFYVVDVRNYRIKLANQMARKMGMIEERTTCYALTHKRTEPCGGDEHPCPLQHVRTSREPYTTEHVHFRPDGSPYYAEVRGYPLFDAAGNVVEMVEYSVDITERKRSEAEIRKLQQAVEHTASGIAITDPDGVLEYVNPAFERMTGYTSQEAIGQPTNLLKSGVHDDAFYQELWDTIESGRVWQGEMVNKRKDGSLYWEFQTIAPVVENGEIRHYVAVKLDITRQKELEQQLVAAREAAEEASALKGRLLSNVSHDMRTPLGGIIGFAEMLLEGVYGEIQPEQQAPLKSIIESANHLASFVSGMLTRAELESGQLQLKPRPFAPQDLLHALGAHAEVAHRKGLEFRTEIDPALPETLYGDTYWLEQVLVNLVDNAIKYTPQGSIQVALRRVDEHRWAIEVQDTGIGIPAELHEHIFNAFEQVESGPGKRIQGVGLGLSIVRELTTALGGEIDLHSHPGQGSTFTIVFPIEEGTHES